MEITIPAKVPKPEKFVICERTDLSIKEVVKELEKLGSISSTAFQPYVVEVISRRIRYLKDRIVEEYLKCKSSK